jgi:polyhydroxybutyrate depolymerase
MTRSWLGPVVLGLAALASGLARAQLPDRVVIQTGHGAREVLVFAAGAGSRPTILVLHGAFGSGEGVARKSGFAEAAARHGFTAVFPSGIDRRWHYGPAVRGEDPDDVGFLRSLVERLVKDGLSDPARIYIAGISNGGMMTFAMECKDGALFAGVATIIANLPAELADCAPRSVPFVMVNGTADPIMPFAGGAVGLFHAGGQVWGTEPTAAFLARTDGCAATPTTQALPQRGPSNGTSVTRLAWTDCKPGTSVTLYRVEDGGHTIPGQPPPAAVVFGATNQDFSAADAIVDVFAGAH